MNHITDALQWRYATKQFDTTKQLDQAQLDVLLHALQLSPSSYGLQPWKFIVVTNPDIRSKLRAAAWDQPQVTDASHLIVFAAKTNITESTVDEYITSIAETRNIAIEELESFSTAIKASIQGKTAAQRTEWAARQAYIALGVLLTAAADARIDAAPMEGFDPAQFNTILGLTDKDLTAVVIAGLGFRSEADPAASMKKARFAKDRVFHHVT